MADSWSLLLIFAAVYLFECCLWLRRGAVAFTCWLGKRSQLRFPGVFFGNWRGGFVLSPPLPPLGEVLVAEQPLFSVNSSSIYSYTAASVEREWRAVQPAKLFTFDQIREIDSLQRKVRVNGEPFVSAFSETHATEIVTFLRRLKSLPTEKRDVVIREFLSASFDSNLLSERLASFRRKSKSIHLLANGLFVYLFVLVPIVFAVFGLGDSWVPLLVILLLQTTTISILFRRAHKRLFTERNDDWFTPFFTMLLAPSAAIRAKDALSKHLLLGFHPIAVAAHVCPETQLEAFARHTLRDLRCPRLPITPSTNPAAIAVEQSFRAATLKALSDFLAHRNNDPTVLSQKPKPTETVHQFFCPRCETQYVHAEAACNECGGIPLQPL